MTDLISLDPLPIAVDKINFGLVKLTTHDQKLLLDLFILLPIVHVCYKLLQFARRLFTSRMPPVIPSLSVHLLW